MTKAKKDGGLILGDGDEDKKIKWVDWESVWEFKSTGFVEQSDTEGAKWTAGLITGATHCPYCAHSMCLRNTCRWLENREGGTRSWRLRPSVPGKDSMPNELSSQGWQGQREQVCAPGQSSLFGKGIQIHLPDLTQYALLSRGEEARLWDKGQK